MTEENTKTKDSASPRAFPFVDESETELDTLDSEVTQ